MSCCAVNSPSVHAGGIFDEVDVLVELLLHRLLRVLDRVHEPSSLKQARGEMAFNFKDTEHFWGEDINHVLQSSCYSEQNSSHHVSSAAGDCNLVDEGNAGKRERGTRDVLEGEWDQQNNIQQREGDDTPCYVF